MKGVATRTIVLLVLGMMVLAFLGYWFYNTFLKGREEVESKLCLAKKISICTHQTTEWDPKCGTQPTPGSEECNQLLGKLPSVPSKSE